MPTAPRAAVSPSPIPVPDWGKDHWSLLGYIETCCVDSATPQVGTLDHRRMRTNPYTHPLLGDGLQESPTWKDEYGTRLQGYFGDGETRNLARRLSKHDDWDCLDDLEAAGYIEIISLVNGLVRMTDAGLAMATCLRTHKAKGGYFATFQPTVIPQ